MFKNPKSSTPSTFTPKRTLVDLKLNLNETETGIVEQQQRQNTSRLLAEQARAEGNDDDPMTHAIMFKLAADRNHHIQKESQKTFGEIKRVKKNSLVGGLYYYYYFQKNRGKPWFSQ